MAGETEFEADTTAGVSPAAKKGPSGAAPNTPFAHLTEVDPTVPDQAHLIAAAPLLVGTAEDAESWWSGDGTTQSELIVINGTSIYFAPGGGFTGFPTMIQPGHIDLVQRDEWANNAYVSVADADANASSTLGPGVLSLQGDGSSKHIIIDVDGDVAIQGVGKISTHA